MQKDRRPYGPGGVSMKSQGGAAGKLLETLANEGVNIDMISTNDASAIEFDA
jgi:aspartokinase